MSTKISLIGSSETTGFKPRFIQPLINTDGEISGQLLLQKIELLQAYRPTAILSKARAMVIDALASDIHNKTLSFGILDPRLYPIVERLRKAKTMVRSAVSGVASFDRKKVTAIRGFDPNAEIAQTVDCSDFLDFQVIDNPIGGNTTIPVQGERYKRCQRLNALIPDLNEFIPKSALHLLYNFVQNPNAETQVVAVKASNHRLALAALTRITGMSFSNVQDWYINGIMLANYEKGIAPLGPQECINALKQKAIESDAIGLDPLTIGIIVGILIKAFQFQIQLIRKLTNQDKATLQQQLPALGTKQFGPEWELDYKGLEQVNPGSTGGASGGNGNNNSGNNNALLFGAAALGLLVLNR